MRSQNLSLDKIEKTRSMPVLEGIAIGAMMLLSIGASATYLYFQAVDAVKAEIKEGIQRSTASVAAMVNGDEHETFTSKEQKFDPNYLKYVAPLERARMASKYVPYIYTNIIKDGKVYFVVNPSPQLDLDKDGFPDDAPDLMDTYDEPSKSLMTALTEHVETVDDEPYTDQWGTFISAYTPIYNSRGAFVGTLGMDLDFSGFEKRLMPTKRAFKTAAITGVVMAILVGVTVWYNRRTVKGLLKSRASIIRKYVSANEFVRNTNTYRADLLAFISRTLANTDSKYHADMLKTFDRLAVLSREDAHFDAENFSLKALCTDILSSRGITDKVAIKIGKGIPEEISGAKTFFGNSLSETVNCLLPLGLNAIEISLARESINFLLITVSFKADTKGVNNSAIADFYKKFKALVAPGDMPVVACPADLTPATICHSLNQLGAEFSDAMVDDTLFSFTLKFAKFIEVDDGAGRPVHA